MTFIKYSQYKLAGAFIAGVIFVFAIIYREDLFVILQKYFGGLATVFSVIVVIVIYYVEQRNKKITAARLVLKEIDAVLPIVTNFLVDRKYDLRSMGINTDHWRNQSYLFISDMSQDEFNRIEKIYSFGRYIQKHMEDTDKYKREEYTKIYQKEIEKEENAQKTAQDVATSKEVSDQTRKIDSVADMLISAFPQGAAKEIKDAKDWTAYQKLRQIARLI